MLEFTRTMIAFRASHRAFQRRRFLTGRPVRHEHGSPLPDVVWLTPDGRAMSDDDWTVQLGRTVGMFVNGEGIRDLDPRGQRHTGSSFLLYFNAGPDHTDVTLPPAEYGKQWRRVIDTADPGTAPTDATDAGTTMTMTDRSLIVMERVD